MLKQIIGQLVIFSLFLSIASASIHLTSPYDITYSQVEKVSSQHGEPNYLKSETLGSIAPGQTLRLVIDRHSGTAFFWDNIELTIMDGWKKTGSKQAEVFTYDVEIPKDAALGLYNVTIHASGDIQVVTPEVITLSLDVKNDVYSFTTEPSYSVYIDASNALPFSLKSDSIGSDLVRLSLEGIPADWLGSKDIILSPNEERRMFFLLDPKIEGTYPIKFKATSALGGAAGSADSELIVYPPSLKSKLVVLNEGFSIVTVVLQPFYSLLSLIGSIF